MQKIINVFVFSLSIISFILWVMILGSGSEIYSDVMFVIAYILMAIPLVTGLFFALRRFANHPESLKRVLILIGGTILIVGISYMLSDSTPVKGASESVSSWVDTGLYVFYIQAVALVALMVYFSLRKIISKN